MPESRVSELSERIRDAKFTREFLGPKVAKPLAGWIDRTFGDDDGADDAGVEAPLEHAVESVADDAASPEVTDVGTQPEVVEGILRPTGFVDVAKAVVANIKEHNLVVVAAGIAFWGLLAIPAVLFATVSIGGLVLDPSRVRNQVNENLSDLPDEVREIIGDQLENVSSGSTGGLITGLVVSLLIALWSSSGAMAKVMATMNTIYGVSETRKFPVLRGIALLMTFGGIVFIAGAIFLLAVLPPLLGAIDGVGDSARTLFNWLRFPVLALVMSVSLGVLYHVGPDRKRNRRYRPVTVGALVATVLWLVLSALFTIYTSTLGSYNETYGSLGGLVVLLLWLFITAFVVLIGAEIHKLTGRDTADPQERVGG